MAHKMERPKPGVVGLPALLAVLLGLSGAPAQAAGPFDGIYVGTSTAAPTNHPNCPGDTNKIVWFVRDSHFQVQWPAIEVALDVDISPDGSFSSAASFAWTAERTNSARRFELTGKVNAGTADATLHEKVCGDWHLVLKRKS